MPWHARAGYELKIKMQGCMLYTILHLSLHCGCENGAMSAADMLGVEKSVNICYYYHKDEKI